MVENIEIREGCRLPVHMLKTNEWRMRKIKLIKILKSIIVFLFERDLFYLIYFSFGRSFAYSCSGRAESVGRSAHFVQTE